MKTEDKNEFDICNNRKARHEYTVFDTIEAGIILQGTEVKSCRDCKAQLDGSYALVQNNELWLIGSNIEEYTFGNRQNHNPKRERKLLLNRREITKFAEQANIKGFTLIPLRLYFSKGKVKVELALCKGKQVHDKRQALKKKDAERELRS